MAPKADEQIVLLTNEQGWDYFSQDPVMQPLFDDPGVVCEIRINHKEQTAVYRVATEDVLGSVDWMEDDYSGAVDVLYYINVWDINNKRLGHVAFGEYDGVEYEVYDYPLHKTLVDVISPHNDDILATVGSLGDVREVVSEYHSRYLSI